MKTLRRHLKIHVLMKVSLILMPTVPDYYIKREELLNH